MNSQFSGPTLFQICALNCYGVLPLSSRGCQELENRCQHFKSLQSLLGHRGLSRETLSRVAPLITCKLCFFGSSRHQKKHSTQPSPAWPGSLTCRALASLTCLFLAPHLPGRSAKCPGDCHTSRHSSPTSTSADDSKGWKRPWGPRLQKHEITRVCGVHSQQRHRAKMHQEVHLRRK